MKKILFISLMFYLVFLAAAQAQQEAYTIMKPDKETLEKWVEFYEKAPRTPMAKLVKEPRGSMSLLDHLKYIPSERDQGSCGNCWAWAGTGCMEISLHVQDDVFDRLSVQYITSCETDVILKTCCDGGWLGDVAEFYTIARKAIPWTNVNAQYQDGDVSCDTPCDSIAASPNYPINFISALTIETQGVDKEQAIANIKSVLDQSKAVWFAFFLPTDADWNTFFDFWGNNNESKIWNPDFACGKDWQDGEGGGHAVLCVGYNDDDPNNRYWIMVNSWGTSGGLRPNGIFRVDMNINYDCSFQSGSDTTQALYWQVLDIDWNLATPTPTPIPGDTCSSAIDASAGMSYSGSTLNYTNNYDPSAGDTWPYSWAMQGPDCVFRIDIPNPAVETTIQARVLSADFDNALYMITDCSDPGGSLLSAKDQYADKIGEQLICKVAGQSTVYIVLDSYHYKVAGPFTIEIQPSGTPLPTFTTTPTPTPTPTATPTPSLMPEEYTYTFDSGNEGWTKFTLPLEFAAPLFLEENGKIGFSPNGSNNCYGSWESRYHTFTVGQKYRARFRIQTNQPDQSKIPTVRIRIQDKKSQVISTQTINSLGDGINSPTLSGMTYEIFYQPPKTTLGEGYFISLDLINIGDADDPNARIYIDMVEIKKVTVTAP
jgi:hypothetical protein